MKNDSTNYKALVAVPVGEGIVYVAFKLKEFRSPVISDSVVDIVQLVKDELADLKKLSQELKKKNPSLEIVAELQSKVKLPEFLSSYVESGQKTNMIFDLLDEKDFKEATIGETKVELQSENEALAARVAELEAQLEKKEGGDDDEDKQETE